MADIVLSEPQRKFARSKFKFPAFVGGFGSGKTFAGALRTVSLKSQCKGHNVAYYLPTYGLVNDIAIPRFGEVMEAFKIKHTLVKSSPPRIDIPDYDGSILFRTLDAPEKIVGYEVAHSCIDELDTLDQDKAKHAWNKIIARNRAKWGGVNTCAVVTTPEGFRFVYDRWVKNGGPKYRLYKARTVDNIRHLPEDYIDSLKETYPAALLSAYLDGEFVNLTQGTVYTGYNRILNFTNESIKPGEPLHIGMDFNVTKMAAVVHVIREGKPYALFEFTNVYDTPAMIATIRAKYPKAQWPTIFIYPDASGNQRKASNASVTDIALLKGNFYVCVNPANPAVKDRILAYNKKLESRDYKVNPDTCPVLAEALEKQAYTKNGDPDKAGGFDHPVDAGGYFVVYKYPVIKRTATIHQLRM